MVVDAIKRSLGCCSKLFSTFIKLKKNPLLWLEKFYFEIQKNTFQRKITFNSVDLKAFVQLGQLDGGFKFFEKPKN